MINKAKFNIKIISKLNAIILLEGKKNLMTLIKKNAT